MALQNGVLVHGPLAWAAAVRLPDGRIEVAAAPKRLRAADVEQPFLRGPARLFEALAVLPELRRRPPACAFRRRSALRSARSQRRPSSSAGWCGTRSAGSRARSPVRDTNSSTAS